MSHPSAGTIIGGGTGGAVIIGTGVGMGYMARQHKHMEEQTAMARKQTDMAEEQHLVAMEVQQINKALAQKQLLNSGPISVGGLVGSPSCGFSIPISAVTISSTVAVVAVAGTLIYLNYGSDGKKEKPSLVAIITELDEIKDKLEKETECGESGAVMAALVRRRRQLEQELANADDQ